jgi:hypothetical protein
MTMSSDAKWHFCPKKKGFQDNQVAVTDLEVVFMPGGAKKNLWKK